VPFVFGETMEGIHITEMKKKKFFERRTWKLLYIKDKEIIYEEEVKGIFKFTLLLIRSHRNRDNIVMESYL